MRTRASLTAAMQVGRVRGGYLPAACLASEVARNEGEAFVPGGRVDLVDGCVTVGLSLPHALNKRIR